MSGPSKPKSPHKKKRAPRAAFVVTVAAVAAVASGCSGSSGSSTNVDNEDNCPSELPAARAGCQEVEEGTECSYTANGCAVKLACGADQQWFNVSPPCEQECPEPFTDSTLDEWCWDEGLECVGPDYGCGPTDFTCEGAWWEESDSMCNPPEP